MRDFFLNKLEIYDDPEFKFDAIKHKYTYDGIDFISVTQFISRFHKKFDSEFWSKKKAEERGVDQQLVLNEWQTLNDRANFIGTSTHNWIENYFNRQFQDLPNDLDVIDRINKFNKIYATHLHKLTPIKFEQRIFSKKWKIAGMIDSIFLWKGNLVMVDYKTNKKFETSNSHGEKLLSPFQDYDKCHLTEYSIQLSLYKLILKEIELDVKVCYLLYIGPDDEAKVHKCHDFSSILEDYLIRLEYLSQITFNPD